MHTRAILQLLALFLTAASYSAAAEKPRMYFADDVSGRPFSKDPAVVKFQGRYWLYYSLPDYKGKPSKGWSIGIATSDNLLDWKKAGELKSSGEVEQNGFCAPGAVVLGDKIHLFYQTYGNGRQDAICHAWSTDGLRFTRNPTNPVFRPSGDWNCGRAIDADAIVHGDRLLLYWATRDPAFKRQMQGVAAAPLTSDFARDKWKQLNPDGSILKPELPWEGDCIEAAAMLRHGGRLYMFYAGNYNNAPQQVGVAVSDDGVRFTRLSDKPFLPNGPPGAWNSSESGHPFCFQDADGKDYLFYQGNNDRGRTWHLSMTPIAWKDDRPVLTAGADRGERKPFAHFITRRGNKLYDGPDEFRFVGANMPGLVLPYDWTLYLPERLHLPTPWEQEDAFKTLDQMNFRVVRLWNLPIRDPKAKAAPWHYVLGPGQFNEEAFKTVDSLLALANKYGVRVVFDFTAEAGDYLGGIGTYAAHRGKKRAEFYTDPQVKEDYKATVRYVLGRTNAITKVPYKEDKAILAWQFGNEMHGAPDTWLAEMAAYIKSLDANHLVAETRHRPGAPLTVDPNIDLYTRHLYGNYPGVGGGWSDAIRKEVARLKGQRPLFIGEYGPYIDGKMFTHANVVARTREFLDYVRDDEGVSGALVWSMYFHHRDGGFYWHQIMTYPAVWSYHWPGFPSAEAQREQGLLAVMREAAFQIQGRAVPPMPVPDPPELLPIGETPLVSWRGSAGASGYDIQRAPQADGPWTAVAKNLSDADVAYRPLWSDTAARPGQTWFYRVTARNISGASRPSNVVGPVRVKGVCFVDELQDLSRARSHSEGLKLSNDFNAMYAEYLFRAQGTKDDWITYEVPGALTSLKVVTFFAEEVSDVTIQVSADGATFGDLKPARQERRLPSPPGGAAGKQRRTMVEYQGTVSPGQRFVRIRWNGPAELDRLEMYHQ